MPAGLPRRVMVRVPGGLRGRCVGAGEVQVCVCELVGRHQLLLPAVVAMAEVGGPLVEQHVCCWSSVGLQVLQVLVD